MRRLVGILLAVSLLLSLAPVFAAAPPAPAAGERKVVAYYFHGTQRCRTCLHIESTAERILAGRFAAEVKAGRLAWRAVDYDRAENEHFIGDFGLVSSSIVLVAYEGSKQVGFKVLDKAWQLVRDDAAFAAYVGDETAAFLNRTRG